MAADSVVDHEKVHERPIDLDGGWEDQEIGKDLTAVQREWGAGPHLFTIHLSLGYIGGRP